MPSILPLATWQVTLTSMAFVLLAGFSHFDVRNFHLPPDPWGDPHTTSATTFIFSLGAACRFGVYDFTGYCMRPARAHPPHLDTEF